MADLNSATARNKVWCTVAAELAALQLTVSNACAGMIIASPSFIVNFLYFFMLYGGVVLECFFSFF